MWQWLIQKDELCPSGKSLQLRLVFAMFHINFLHIDSGHVVLNGSKIKPRENTYSIHSHCPSNSRGICFEPFSPHVLIPYVVKSDHSLQIFFALGIRRAPNAESDIASRKKRLGIANWHWNGKLTKKWGGIAMNCGPLFCDTGYRIFRMMDFHGFPIALC